MTPEQEKRLEKIRRRHEKSTSSLERTGRLRAIEAADDRAHLLALVDELREELAQAVEGECARAEERDEARAECAEAQRLQAKYCTERDDLRADLALMTERAEQAEQAFDAYESHLSARFRELEAERDALRARVSELEDALKLQASTHDQGHSPCFCAEARAALSSGGVP